MAQQVNLASATVCHPSDGVWPRLQPVQRWRRTYPGAPYVSTQEFTRAFARCIEASCRTDVSALPIISSVAYKHTVEHTMGTVAPIFGKTGSATNTQAAEYIKAAQNLYHHLHHGLTGSGLHRVPIAGDTTRLPFAVGLTPLEKRLARAQQFLARHLGGSQQLRQLMGHSQFGARIVFGDCLFITISPIEQQSALALRLSRFPHEGSVRH